MENMKGKNILVMYLWLFYQTNIILSHLYGSV